jgi:hypothetical protein
MLGAAFSTVINSTSSVIEVQEAVGIFSPLIDRKKLDRPAIVDKAHRSLAD